MYMIVGLGNPGKAYEGTRHNVGFAVVDQLSRAYKIPVRRMKKRARTGEGDLAQRRVILVKPLTFMNASGDSVAALIQFYKIPPSEMIVIYDDIHLPMGDIRVREKGSAGGHNGMKSIIARLGTDAFPRVRIGIGQRPPDWELADYVLSRFSQTEAEIIANAVTAASEATALIIAQGTAAAMNRYNSRLAREGKP